MIDYNKFIKKCSELKISGGVSSTYVGKLVTRPETPDYININVHFAGDVYIIDTDDEYVEQWLECFYRCKEL